VGKYKLVLFDMDGTLLKDRSIFVFGEKFGFIDELWKIFKNEEEFYKKSIKIARFFKDMKSNDILDIFRTISLNDHVETVLNELKNNDVKIGIATDSYQFLADDLKNRLGVDFAFANNLIIEKGVITGEVKVNNEALVEDIVQNRVYSINKCEILRYLCQTLDIDIKESIAVGDGIVDISMINSAGIGIAYNASEQVQKYADIVTNDMRVILDQL